MTVSSCRGATAGIRLDAVRARGEERRGGVLRDVVDMDDPVTLAAPRLDDARGIGGGGIGCPSGAKLPEER
jgi:hypothetical protein